MILVSTNICIGAFSRLLHSKLLLSKTSSFHFCPKYIDKCELIWQRDSSSKQNCGRDRGVGGGGGAGGHVPQYF